MAERFYYLDEDDVRRRYVGKIIENDGKYNGILTKVTKSSQIRDLIYHPAVEEVKESFAYYSYINNEGEEMPYYDTVKRDGDGQPYFTYVERDMFKLEHHPEVPSREEYYTYIDPATNEECLYTGKVNFNKTSGTYTGVITR